MPIAIQVIGLVLGAIGVIQQYQAGQQAEENARANADLQRQETEEAIRRQKDVDARNSSMARARAAASGVKLEGSTSGYLNWMSTEQSRQRDWMKRSGDRSAKSIEYGGSLARSQANAGAASNAGQLAGQAYTFGESNDWFKNTGGSTT